MLLGRAVTATCIGIILVVILWYGLNIMVGLLLNLETAVPWDEGSRDGSFIFLIFEETIGGTPKSVFFTIYFPIAIWLTVGYMAVVRFLGYLDLRIRREGWEVELRLRAEALKLTGRTA